VQIRDKAPTPAALGKHFDKIQLAADKLLKLLNPRLSFAQSEVNSRDYAAANRAASNVRIRLRMPKSSHPDDEGSKDEANEDGHVEASLDEDNRIEEFEVFERLLSEIRTAAIIEKNAINEVGTDGEPWKIISERRTGHYHYLVTDLRRTAERHGWQMKYTLSQYSEIEALTSPIAKLAMVLADKLPEEARPKSIHALIRVMRLERSPRNGQT